MLQDQVLPLTEGAETGQAGQFRKGTVSQLLVEVDHLCTSFNKLHIFASQ